MRTFAIWFKVLTLVAAFAAVMTVMHFVQKGGIEQSLRSAGFAPNERAGTVNSLNLCATRVRAIEFPDGWRIYEDGRSWRTNRDQTLDSVEVERWLARNCQVRDGQPVVSRGMGRWQKVFTIEYADGKRRDFEKLDQSYWSNDQTFISAGFESALEDLRRLPEKAKHP